MAAEIKGVDTVLTTATVIATTTTNGDFFIPTLVPPGSAAWQRNGRKVFPRSIRIYGSAIHVYAPQATTGDLIGNTLRMVVVWDSNPNGGATVAGGGAAIPSFDTIFGSTTQAGTVGTTFLDPIKFSEPDRFKILRDLKIASSPEATSFATGTTLEVQQRFIIDEYFSFPRGTSILFGGQSNPCTIADVQAGACYIIFRASNSDATNFWNIPSSTKVRFRYFD